MATFLYTARTRSGERTEGSVEASDRRGAVAQLERQGLVPMSVAERSATVAAAAQVPEKGLTWSRGRARMGTRELLTFTTELSDLLASGMTLGNALNALASRKTGRPADQIIASLRDEIVRGASFSDAVSQHPSTFSKLYASMIRAGEVSGALDKVLERLVVHYERVQQTREKVIMALVYPCIVMVLGAATLVFSMVFLVPKFKMIFEQVGAGSLPFSTRMLIASSDWMTRYGIFALIGVAFAGVMAYRALKTEHGRVWWDGIVLRLPLVRGIVTSAIYSNFAQTLGTLLTNGVPVLQALSIVERTVGNSVIAREIHNARDRVTDGTTISGPLAAGKVFPPIMTDMLSIGEQTGDMPGALDHVARRYENELDRHVKVLTTALEPILIVVVAILVGFVAISILMAVLSLTKGLNV